MRRKLSFITVLIVYTLSIHSVIYSTFIDETALKFRVKQIDEFFMRFNYEIDYKGDVPNDTTNREERKKNMLTVFNLERFQSQNSLDSTANAFVDYVIDNHLAIHYEDTTWFAEASGSLTYAGKSYPVTFILKTERERDVVFKWVVSDIHSTLFDSFSSISDNSITISPADHGISFMSLPETFNLNKTIVGTAFAKGYKRSNLVVYDYLMATGKVKQNLITNVKYHFHLGEAYFTVEKIDKEKEYNQGWLINELKFRKENNHED